MKTRILATDSSLVKGVRYNPNTRDLDLDLDGKIYRYKNVKHSVFSIFITSESTGKAYNNLIKGVFKSVKLRRTTL